ncbi:MAG: homoserine dehydrogenase, partial [Cytophaga sp.]|nr:homoserine dehydrogenase [Cytophaga sp.]
VDLKYARENGYTIKLIAQARKIGDKVYGFVAPQYIEATNPLASVRNEYNAVQLEGAFAEKQLFVGKGAGSYPTGSAVLSDISALTYDYSYEYKKISQERQVFFSNDALVEAVVSFKGEDIVTSKEFEKFEGGYRGNGYQFLRGTVKLEKLREWSANPEVSVILTTTSKITPLQPVDKKALSFA